MAALQPAARTGFWQQLQPSAEHVQVEERELLTSAWGRSTSRSHTSPLASGWSRVREQQGGVYHGEWTGIFCASAGLPPAAAASPGALGGQPCSWTERRCGVFRLRLYLLGSWWPCQPLKLCTVPAGGQGTGPFISCFPAEDPRPSGVSANVQMGSTSYFQYFQNLKAIPFYR